MKTQPIALPSHMFIPASADLTKPYLSVLAVGSLRLEACDLLEGEDKRRSLGFDYFVKKVGATSLLIYDLAGTKNFKTQLELLGKKASIVLFFGDQSEKFENELKRLGLSEGKTFELANTPSLAGVNNDNYAEKLMTFLNEIISELSALTLPQHPCQEDMKGKGCQIL